MWSAGVLAAAGRWVWDLQTEGERSRAPSQAGCRMSRAHRIPPMDRADNGTYQSEGARGRLFTAHARTATALRRRLLLTPAIVSADIHLARDASGNPRD
jgi:hypothetical protein